MKVFEKQYTATGEEIDELGHVNNAAWVRWIQDMSTSHWFATADAKDADAYVWVVTRHEVDYLRSLGPGETVTGRTWVSEPPQGARFARHVEFVGDNGKVHVRATSTWAVVQKETRRPIRVPPHLTELFLSSPQTGAGADRHGSTPATPAPTRRPSS